MEDRTMQLVPGKDGLNELVVTSNSLGGESSCRNQRGSTRKAVVSSQLRRDVEEMFERSSRSSRRETREGQNGSGRRPRQREYIALDGDKADNSPINTNEDGRPKDAGPMDIVDVLLERWTNPINTISNPVSQTGPRRRRRRSSAAEDGPGRVLLSRRRRERRESDLQRR